MMILIIPTENSKPFGRVPRTAITNTLDIIIHAILIMQVFNTSHTLNLIVSNSHFKMCRFPFYYVTSKLFSSFSCFTYPKTCKFLFPISCGRTLYKPKDLKIEI